MKFKRNQNKIKIKYCPEAQGIFLRFKKQLLKLYPFP
jgi:hypothetical protein